MIQLLGRLVTRSDEKRNQSCRAKARCSPQMHFFFVEHRRQYRLDRKKQQVESSVNLDDGAHVHRDDGARVHRDDGARVNRHDDAPANRPHWLRNTTRWKWLRIMRHSRIMLRQRKTERSKK